MVLYFLPTGFISGFNPGSMVLGVLGAVALSAPTASPFPENVGVFHAGFGEEDVYRVHLHGARFRAGVGFQVSGFSVPFELSEI